MDAVDTNTLTPEQKTVFDTQVESGILPANAFANVGSITSDSLKASETPVSLPETTPSTTANALSGIAQATAEQIKLAREQERKAREAQNAVSASRNDLTTLMDEITGVQRSQGQLEAQAGLPEKQQRVTDVTNQIEASIRAQTNELRALEKANLTDSGRAAAIRDINRKYAFEQADLALIQSAANRDLETASNIVNRKIELALEPIKTRLDFTKLFYEDNKDALSKAEDRAFQTQVKKLDREYETANNNLKSVSDLNLKLIEKGITPTKSLLNATTQDEWMQAVIDDKISFITGGSGATGVVTLNGKPLTDGQATSLGFARRMAQANTIIDSIGSQFASVSSFGGLLPSGLQSADRQRYEQAKRNFVNAVLRKESGAAISPSEFSSAEKQYFPQAGDKPEVIAQKKQNRELVVESMAIAANVPLGEVTTENTEDPLGLGVETDNPLDI